MNSAVIICILMIAAVSICCATRKIDISVAFILVGLIGAWALGCGPTIVDLVKGTLTSTLYGTILVIFFGLFFFQALQDTGFFDVIVYKMYKMMIEGKKSTLVLYLATMLICSVFYIACANIAGYIVTIGSLRPIYEKMKISRSRLVVIVGLMTAVFFNLPWNGLNLTFVAMFDLDANTLLLQGLPMMISLVAAQVLVCIYWAAKDKKEGIVSEAGFHLDWVDPKDDTSKPDFRINLFWVNTLIFLGAMVAVFTISSIYPAWLIFAIGAAVTFLVNYRTSAHVNRVYKECGFMFFMICGLVLPIQLYCGVLSGSGAISALVEWLSSVLPSWILTYLYLPLFVAMPFVFQYVPYQVYMALLPFLISCATAGGVPVYLSVSLFVTLMNAGTYHSPTVSMTMLACSQSGVAQADLKKISVPVTMFMAVIVGIAHVVCLLLF